MNVIFNVHVKVQLIAILILGFVITLCCQATGLERFTNNSTISVSDDEAQGPFESWINIKSYGAVGDGVVDDTK